MIQGRHNPQARPFAMLPLVIVACAGAGACAAAAASDVAKTMAAPTDAAPSLARAGSHPTRQQLVGLWRLSSIEFSGVEGRMTDPFYQPDSIGLIAYDASGRMSVQIAAPHRLGRELPASRNRPARGAEAAAKAAAFDSYYAYFGTWSYDAVTAVMTHHVESSLLPAEIGVNFTQEVTLQDDRLIFTNHNSYRGKPTTRIKVWRRVTSGG